MDELYFPWCVGGDVATFHTCSQRGHIIVNMVRLLLLFALPVLAGSGHACAPLRVAYIDQHRPPYYLGAGGDLQDPPGASVELLKEIVEAGGCRIQFVRLPLLRIRPAVESGLVDAAPIDPTLRDAGTLAFPRDRHGKPDVGKALSIYNIVWVRSADKVPQDIDPMAWLRNRTLGTAHGAPYAAEFRKAGINVDDGAMDVKRNLDKLVRKRIDAFVTTVTSPEEMDGFVAGTYGNTVTRLVKPIRVSYVYFAVNRDYYARNKQRVDTMWRWIGMSGRQRFDQLLAKYEKKQQ
jgi:hypothetical protein